MSQTFDTISDLQRHLESGADLDNRVVKGLDLTGLSALLEQCSGAGAAFLGCQLSASASHHLQMTGALVFPSFGDIAFDPYRSRLYTADELMRGYERARPDSFWTESVDAKIYAAYQQTRQHGFQVPVMDALSQRVHDHAIDDALAKLLLQGADGTPRRLVAVMGGHSLSRRDVAFRQVALFARDLTRRGYFLCSGGGPGAMEATNLGAWLGAHEDAALDDALALLAKSPTYRDEGWLECALCVRDRYPNGHESLGIPTWFYGHEPSNVFATHIAKYFSNSLREDGLLAIAKHGVIYAPGRAGTVQEIFMDAAQNHYGTFDDVSPMVFVNRSYWTQTLPVQELILKLSRGRQYANYIAFVDEAEEAVRFIVEHPPTPYEEGA